MNTNMEHYRAEYDRTFATHSEKNLSWLKQLRETALAEFMTRGLPTFHDEDWKYTNITPIARRLLTLPTQPSAETIHQIRPREFLSHNIDCYLLVFVDGYFCAHLSQLNGFPKQIIASSLSEAFNKHPELVQAYLGKHNDFTKPGFAALNSAFIQDGAFIYLPENTSLSKPIELLFVSTTTETPTFIPIRNLIIAEENTDISIIEKHGSLGDNVYFSNSVTELILGKKSRIEHYQLLQQNEKSFHVSNFDVAQDTDSEFVTHSFTLGGALVRNDTHIKLNAENARCTLNGLYLTRDKQHVDNQTLIEHLKPHGTSHEHYKGIIADHSKAVFCGKVHVHQDAQKTDATQSNKNLLLSENAEVYTKPQLDIFADDVKCAHGAAVGQLDAESLFYLRSRGMDESAAREMLLSAFALDILDKITLTPLRLYLQKCINEKL